MEDDIGTDEYTEKTLQEAFKPATLPTAYKDQLLKDMIKETSGIIKASKSRF